jgi:hypothetical protein
VDRHPPVPAGRPSRLGRFQPEIHKTAGDAYQVNAPRIAVPDNPK